MYLSELLQLYAKHHCLSFKRAFELYQDGYITPWELMDEYLANEGIFGYTTGILHTARELLLHSEYYLNP